MLLRYEAEVRDCLDTTRAELVRRLRVSEGETWRGVGSALRVKWELDFGNGDPQSLGATLCHVAAEMLGENPDGEPWN